MCRDFLLFQNPRLLLVVGTQSVTTEALPQLPSTPSVSLYYSGVPAAPASPPSASEDANWG